MNKLICRLIGHRYFVVKRFSIDCRKVGCSRCLKSWAMNDSVKAFLPWDSDFDALHGSS